MCLCFSPYCSKHSVPLFWSRDRSLSRSTANPSSLGFPSLLNASCRSNGDMPKAGRWFTYTAWEERKNENQHSCRCELSNNGWSVKLKADSPKPGDETLFIAATRFNFCCALVATTFFRFRNKISGSLR